MAKYKCIKCGRAGSYSVRPLTGNCSKGGGHRWVSDNNTTSRPWRCSKCGSGTTSSSHPLVGTCSRGGGHSWRKA